MTIFSPCAALLLAGLWSAEEVELDQTPPVPTVDLGARPRPSHPYLALAETAFALGFNVVWYNADSGFNAPDWELRWDRESWYRKAITFDAVRLDTNRFSTNAGSHTMGGTLIYLIGRGNGLGPGASTLLSLGEIIAWEYLAEYAEKPSLNDMFNNSLGGLAVGEPLFQLSEFFARGADNGVNRTLAAIFSPVSAANEWWDGRRTARGPTDRLGLPRDVWHHFDLYAGLASARWTGQLERTETLLGVRTEINTLPGHGTPGTRAGFFGATRLTRLDAGLALTNQGMTGALFATRVGLGGHRWEELRRDEAGELRGSQVLAAALNSFEYTAREHPGLPFDQIASFGVVGPAVEVAHLRGPMRAHLRVEALPSLAMVTSLAGDRYKARSGTEGIKSVLAQRGYYYAYGVTLGSQLALRYRALQGGLEARLDHFESIDARDRYQERLTRDSHLTDGRLRSMAWLNLRSLAGYADLGVALERVRRYGEIEDVTAVSIEHRATLTLSLIF
jgi:hypothetical protein